MNVIDFHVTKILSEKYGKVYELYGMTIDELADMSGRSKSSVKTTLFRIRAELKKYLDEEGVYL